MASDSIGAVKCFAGCGALARVTVSKKQLCCVTCNACNSQFFARSDRSDELIRSRIVKTAAEPAKPVDAPAPAPVPLAPAVAPAAPVPAPVAPKASSRIGLIKLF